MSKFRIAVMTDQGAALLAQSIVDGSRVEFVKMVIGSGEYEEGEKATEELRKRQNLKEKQQEIGFSSVTATDENAVFLKALITNKTLDTGYRMTEIGIIAKKEGEGNEEILYSVAVAEEADYLPSKESPAEITQGYYTRVSNAENVYINVKMGAVALAEDFESLKKEVDEQAESTEKVTSGSGQVNKVWKTDANGVPDWRDDNDTTYSNFVKSGSGAKAGLVPAPSTTAGATKYLREDGTWQTPPDTNTVYTHPTTAGNKHIPSGGSSGQILRWSADGTAAWGADNNTTYSNFVKSGSGAKAGLVPAPSTTAGATKYLREDGTWQTPPDTNTVYTHPTTAGNKHIPSGGSSGQILRWSADGTAAWGADNNTTYSNFVKSGSGAKAGLVPAPSTTAGTTKYLREDGTWQTPPDTNTTYSNMTGATASAVGKSGLVPEPAAGAQAKYLTGAGTWQNVDDHTAAFTSTDVVDGSATNWTTVAKLTSGETHKSIFNKISAMFKNVRYLHKMLGTTDISGINDGTVTGAINALNTEVVPLGAQHMIFTFSNKASISGGKYVTNTQYLPKELSFNIADADFIGSTGNFASALTVARNGNYIYLYATNANFAGLTVSCTGTVTKSS